ncbi:MAG TPA: XdhC family protein [Ktedonobacteraceae bacterium]|jgi:xanthine dehydrogenase accessory factor|nr:XdhC family protein [Ktedonobacteraceae bacterium]
MSETILELAYKLTRDGEPFVLATVVSCERPTSAKPGAQAIIQRDGRMTGWIGGSCAQPVVLREAMRVLNEGGEPYLLHLGTSPDDHAANRSDVRYFPMTCNSGGALEIYIEPHLPRPHLLLIGDSPVITALSQMASVLNFAVTQLDHADLSEVQINEQTYILIATHGLYDEDALEQALPSAAPYVGMVGSRRRADICRAYLRESGIPEQHIARLRAPAGLDIGAITPEEIASSILAELVQARRLGLPNVESQPERVAVEPSAVSSTNASNTINKEGVPPAVAQTAIDPVCTMVVEIASARHRTTYDGHDFYFCCPSCKRLFERNPQEYLVQS